MAQPSPTTTVTNPRIAKLIELEVAGRIKPEHQQELDTYRAQGLAPKKTAGNSLTEYQGKSTGFYERALGADADFLAAGEGGSPVGVVGDAARSILPENVVNSMTSTARQKAEQAKRDFVSASLRYESGAAISAGEFANQEKVFFPQTGDSPETIAQKAAARKRVIESLKVAAGPGAANKGLNPANAAPKSPLDPEGAGDIGFASRASNEANSLPPGAQDFQKDLQTRVNSGEFKTPEEIIAYGKGKGFNVNPEDAKAAIDYFNKGGREGVSVLTPQYEKPDISDVRGNGDSIEVSKAFLRGIPSMLGVDDELGAVADTAHGGTLRENLARERAIRDYDEQNHPIARFVGSLVGAAAIPTGAPGVARAAGVDALRMGLGRSAAETAAKRAFAGRAALEGGGLAALYGAGASDGNLADRALGALETAPIGAGLGYGVTRLGQLAGIGSKTPPIPPSDGRRVVDAADRLSAETGAPVQVLPADVGGTGTKMAQGVVGRTLGEIPLQQAKEKSIESVRDARDAVASRTGMVGDETTAGQAAQRGSDAFISNSHARGDQLYERVPVPNETKVELGATRAALDAVTKGFKSNDKLSKLWTGNERLKQTLEALTPVDTREAGRVKLSHETERFRGAESELNSAREEAVSALQQDRALAHRDLSTAQKNYDGLVERARQEFERAKSQLDATRNQVPTAGDGGEKIRAAADAAKGRYMALRFKDASSPEVKSALDSIATAQKKVDELQALKPSTPRLDAATKALDAAKSGRDQAYIEANQPPVGGELSWQDMKRLRSIVGEIIGQPSMTSDGATNAAMRKFYGALSSDMEATAAKSGPAALKEWNRATQYWRGRQDRIDNVISAVLGAKRAKGEQQAFGQIESWMRADRGDALKIGRLMRSLPEDDANTIRATLISRMGRAKPGNQSADGDAFSPSTFLTNWSSMSDRAKMAMFSEPGLRRSLDDLATVTGGMKASEAYTNRSNTTLGTNAVAAATGLMVAPFTTALAAAGSLGAGKLMSSQWLVRRLTKVAEAKSRGEAESLLAQTAKRAYRDPVIAAPFAEFEKAFLAAANDNVAKVAASTSEEKQQAQGR